LEAIVGFLEKSQQKLIKKKSQQKLIKKKSQQKSPASLEGRPQ